MKSYRRRDYHNYVIRFYTRQSIEKPNRINVLATSIEDAMKSFNEKVNDLFPGQDVVKIISIRQDGNLLQRNIVDAMNASYLDECDGGVSGGGDVGGVTGDAGSAESGISSGDVLGNHDHNDYAGGFMGPGCFHMPSHVKTPLHRYELCNGGSKRKKTKSGKDKKYAYENGMKVVVDMFEDEMLNEWSGISIKDLRGKSWESVKNLKNPPSYERWEAAQLPDPEYKKHGELGGCEITADDGKRPYMKEYYLHGHYEDGAMFEMGPMRSKVLREYINLHKISVTTMLS